MKRLQLLQLFDASKNGFRLGVAISLCFYAVIRLMFYEFRLPIEQELLNVGKIILIGGLMISGGVVLFNLIEIFLQLISRVKFNISRPVFARVIGAVVLMFMISIADAQPKVTEGTKKNAKNGFATKYVGLIPSKSFMQMNSEELNHNDIPMGESFLIINEKVTGFVQREGKTSVGCSLVITDKKGKRLVEIADIFKGKDVMLAKDASTLKCTVPTTKLTGWEEKYDVTATFWDKYGKGNIVNKVKIRMIDMP